MADGGRETGSVREEECAALRELLRLARRCVSPFVDGEGSSYTQAEALHDLEEWLRAQPPRRERR
jgi:hypothetical protein